MIVDMKHRIINIAGFHDFGIVTKSTLFNLMRMFSYHFVNIFSKPINRMIRVKV